MPIRPGRRNCFFDDATTTEIYTLSLHDALPISDWWWSNHQVRRSEGEYLKSTMAFSSPSNIPSSKSAPGWRMSGADRKSTRLNSSHVNISYAALRLNTHNVRVLCLAQLVHAARH